MGETTGPVRGDSPEEIRREIDATQREMSHTIDEIQYRLSPAHLKHEARESVRRAGLRTSRSVVERVKANPIGAAMVGVGLWMLMRNDGRDDAYDYEIEFEPEFDDVRYYGAGAGEFRRTTRPDTYGYGTADEHGRMSEVKDRVGDAMHDAKERISETADDVRERTSEMAASARQRARELRYRTRYQTRNLKNQSRELMMDNPLIAGVAAVALGAIVGAMIPETERENELFGEASDRLGERVGEVAREGLDQAKDIAGAAATAATQAAKRETETAKEEMKQTLRNSDEMRR
jgi:ElaB/YqjD/DUF883 family membrane-anchored ribosome-binding protein